MMISVTSSSHKVALVASISLNFIFLMFIACYNSNRGGIDRVSSAALEQHNSGAVQNFVFDCDISMDNVYGNSKEVVQSSRQLQNSNRLAGGQAPRQLSEGQVCYDKHRKFKQGARGNFWVMYNYVTAVKDFKCNESITYTTHGDFTFFDNLEPLLERWQGPVSLSVYAPSTDYKKTLDSILYYRECTGRTLVKDFVTFHVYFDLKYIPAEVVQHNRIHLQKPDCSNFAQYGEEFQTFKKENNLTYPINVARNVAREMASTHFVFPSDIELYPSPNLIPTFLEMIRRNDNVGTASKPRVYVNSIFEIQKNATYLPTDKIELVRMIDKGVVIPFHKQVCPSCHKIPYSKAWLSSDVKVGMHVIHVGKRVRPYQHWEPIYIGTNQEPWYDERLTWEGRSDKMSQGYKMCLLDYEFHILDNAFLIHRPGIKTKEKLKSIIESKRVSAQNTLLKKTIFPEIQRLYTPRKGCEMFK